MSDERIVDADGVAIAYDDRGSGDPVVLLHGFASSRHGTWRDQGWYSHLTDRNRRVIALDCRGHGASSKPRDADAYGPAAMSDDVVRVLDHCGLAAADVLGYSMGGRLAMQLLVDCPDRFDRAVLAGVGERALAETRYSGHIADALEADDPSELEDATARDFRAFAEGRDNDLAALAACRRAPQPGLELDGEALRTISSPVLVVAGAADELVGEPGPLADAIPGAEATAIPGCDHLSTVGDTRFRDDVLEFLARP